MLRSIICFFLVGFSAWVFGQSQNCTDESINIGKFYKVIAKSGVNLRASPSKLSAKVCSIPFGEEVFGCSIYANDFIEGIAGKWISVAYGEQKGFLFDGFLEESATNKIGFFIPGSVAFEDDPYNEKEEYWGMISMDAQKHKYYEKKCQGFGHFKFVKLKIGWVTKIVDGDTIKKFGPIEHEDEIELVVYGFKPNTDIFRIEYFGNLITPGGSVAFTCGDKNIKRERNYTVFATGKPIQSEKSDFRMFSKIEDYTLYFREFQLKNSYSPVTFVGEQKIVHRDISCDNNGLTWYRFDAQKTPLTLR